MRSRQVSGSVYKKPFAPTGAAAGWAAETAARPETDMWISAAIVIEATSEAGARRAKAALPDLLGANVRPSAIGIYSLIALQDAPSA